MPVLSRRSVIVTRDPHRVLEKAARPVLERLENRRLLCAWHDGYEEPVEVGGDPVPESQPEALAVISWTNRATTTTPGAADTDRFAAVFGANANVARNVVDAVLRHFERMIGAFNYSNGSNTFNVTINMASTGSSLGASASLNTLSGGKPKSGTVTMGRGSNGAGGGWFLDPTPDDHSEFLGTITNAFSGNAQTGSPAAGLSDFYTVVAAEITHCLGLFSGVALWDALTTNTGLADTAEGATGPTTGTGTFYAFQGPSIKHLLTSNNGGPGGSSFPGAVHAAGPTNINTGNPTSITFNGETWIGAQDHGNAIYEQSRRYIPSNTFALMFKDAYAYSTVDPSTFGNFYTAFNQSNGQLLIRGGSNNSNDSVTISRVGNTLTVSNDIGNDIAGTGHLPGEGNLPAFVSVFDLTVTPINSIVIQTGDGNDTINIQSVGSIPVNIDAGTGNDTITIGGGDFSANILGAITINGNTGTDTLTIDDTASTIVNDTYTVNASGFTKSVGGSLSFSNMEGATLNASNQSSIINLNGTATGVPWTLNGNGGNDTFNITPTPGNLSSLLAALTANGGSGSDTLIVHDGTFGTATTYTVTSTTVARTGSSMITYAAMEGVSVVAGTNNDTINVNSTAANVPVTLDGGNGNDTYNVNETNASGPAVILASAGTDVANVNTDNTGSATAIFSQTITLSSLSIGTGGVARVIGGTLILGVSGGAGTLSIPTTGQLDLTNRFMIFRHAAGSVTTALNTIRGFVASGATPGMTFNGPGINSANAAAQSNTAVGFSSNAGPQYATFGGVSGLTGNEILVRYTLRGDANLDGTVNGIDFNVLAPNFGQTPRVWSQGDFNYDQTVNGLDFNMLAPNFGQSVPGDPESGNGRPGAGEGGDGSARVPTLPAPPPPLDSRGGGLILRSAGAPMQSPFNTRTPIGAPPSDSDLLGGLTGGEAIRLVL